MPTFTFGTALTDLAKKIHSTNADNFSCIGLGSGQKRVLFTVLDTPGITGQAIAHYLGIDKSVVSRAVKALILAGYVKKSAGREKRSIYPTRMAATMGKFAALVLDDIESRLTEGFSDEELAAFKLSIQRISLNLNRQSEESRKRTFWQLSDPEGKPESLPMDF